jgi:hypothetical protein
MIVSSDYVEATESGLQARPLFFERLTKLGLAHPAILAQRWLYLKRYFRTASAPEIVIAKNHHICWCSKISLNEKIKSARIGLGSSILRFGWPIQYNPRAQVHRAQDSAFVGRQNDDLSSGNSFRIAIISLVREEGVPSEWHCGSFR